MSEPIFSKEELRDSWRFWESAAKRHEAEAEYYRQQLVCVLTMRLVDVHALLGRIIHQTSERWGSVNLTKHFPTDNLHGNRTINNPGGKT